MRMTPWYWTSKKQVPPGFEPGLVEVSSIRIHCDDRYTTEPTHYLESLKELYSINIIAALGPYFDICSASSLNLLT